MNALAPHAGKVLSILRVMTGLMFTQHGLQKIVSFPAAAQMPFSITSQLGIGGVLEVVGGALIALGLFTRPIAFVLSGMMAVAYFQFHASNSLYPLVNGGELAALYCFVFLYLSFAGPGTWAVDTITSGRRRR